MSRPPQESSGGTPGLGKKGDDPLHREEGTSALLSPLLLEIFLSLDRGKKKRTNSERGKEGQARGSSPERGKREPLAGLKRFYE